MKKDSTKEGTYIQAIQLIKHDLLVLSLCSSPSAHVTRSPKLIFRQTLQQRPR